ncbi:MAG: hemerythrin domain-containing protein [Nitriliruptorales bacterium]|nr:hemerythrin domain-containing protein [Nitriliruptorales bacterium]
MPDAVDVLVQDHREVEELFSRYERAANADERGKIVHAVIHELAVHGEIEELLFYPRVRTSLPDGDALADEAVDEHLEIKKALNDLDKMTARDDGFEPRMRELMAEVRHHVEEEENDMFPRIRDAIDREPLEQLGNSLQAVKKFVPTRPHPGAPTGPAGKLATAPPVALVDRVRDTVRSWRDDYM